MYDFKTFGQMNLDIIFKEFPHMPDSGEEVFAELFDMQLGGGPMLYPVILNNLGLKAKLGTFLSDDEPGWICKNIMNKMGFDGYENFYTGKEKPVVVTSVFSLESDRSFVSFNKFINEAQLSDEEVYHFLKDARVISVPIGHENVLKRLYQEGKKIVFDVSWNEDVLNADNLKKLLQYVTVFSPNDKEALKLTGKETLEEALCVLKDYTETPVITTGKKGCMYYDHGIKYIPAMEQFNSIDTTGAGDNFVTGIIYGLIKEYPMEDCLRLGNIFAGYSTTGLGCYGALITQEIIDTYYNRNI
jgi:ribokinase